MDTSVGEKKKLEEHPHFDRQPVQITEHRCNVCRPWAVSYNSGCIVLHLLQAIQLTVWKPVQQGIAVVQPGCYKGMDKLCSCQVWKKMPHCTNVTEVKICCTTDILDLTVHVDLAVQHDPKTFA